MLRCVPDPYPDEIFYSICARFSDCVRYYKPQRVMLDLFGTQYATAAVTFPCYLDYFADQLPSGSIYTAEYLIAKHTLFPFYGAFLSSEKLHLLVSDIRGKNGLIAHMHAGISGSRITLPKRLR